MSTSDPRLDADLTAQALLYAHGELEEPQAGAFEKRLAEDQAARDALCQAVQLTQTLAGLQPTVPDPAYRDRVRHHLAGRAGHAGKYASRSWYARLWQPKLYRGHPAAWLATGALAATLLMTLCQPWFGPAAPPIPLPEQLVQPAPAPALPMAADDEPTGAMAKVWAELHNSEHLEQVRDEEHRRKQRGEERRLARHEGKILRKPGS